MIARLSQAQAALLRDLATCHAAGRPLRIRPYSRRETTAFALERRGLIERRWGWNVGSALWEITDAGLAATQEQTP